MIADFVVVPFVSFVLFVSFVSFVSFVPKLPKLSKLIKLPKFPNKPASSQHSANFLSEGVSCGLDKEIALDGTYSKYFPFRAMI